MRPAAVLIPIRSFDDAKTRLADVLSAADRRRLSIAMAERVVHAAGSVPVHVVTGDAAVARWAERLGASVVDPNVTGLNPSVQAAFDTIAGGLGSGDRIIVAHADLPHAADLTVVTGPGFAVAPDRHRDGSNVVSLPVGAADFTFRYGPGSFAAHLAEAERVGLEVTIVEDPSLALDVDGPADLLLLES